MNAHAIVLEEPRKLALRELALNDPGDDDVVVDVEWSGISTGTERLLWSGRMPAFPGMGYPLVPGYESIGRIVEAGKTSGRRTGERVFIPGANCYQGARGLFGGAASRVVVAGRKASPVDESLGSHAILMALAATACHAVMPQTHEVPELIIGHGVLGRLIARIVVAHGGEPVVWETNEGRRSGDDSDAHKRRCRSRGPGRHVGRSRTDGFQWNDVLWLGHRGPPGTCGSRSGPVMEPASPTSIRGS